MTDIEQTLKTGAEYMDTTDEHLRYAAMGAWAVHRWPLIKELLEKEVNNER